LQDLILRMYVYPFKLKLSVQIYIMAGCHWHFFVFLEY
jgi:hypothetical protein